MGERMEVEVVCPRHSAEGRGTCIGCQADFTRWLPVNPGSLTAALLRLGLAAEAYFRAQGDERGEWDVMVQASFDLALLRTKRAGG